MPVPSSTSSRLRRPRWVAVLAAGAVVTSLVAAASGPAAADPLADARARAAEVASQLEALRNESGHLTEQYHAANARLGELQGKVAEAEAAVARVEAEARDVRTRVSDFVRRSYVHADTAGTMQILLLGSTLDEAGPRSGYVDAALKRDRTALDDLRAVGEDSEAEHARLEEARSEAAAVAAQAEADRVAAAESVAAQEALLGDVQGELAELVRQEEERRAAAEAAAAREAAARRAAEAAAPATRGGGTTTHSPGGGSGGSGGSGGGAPATPDAPPAPAPAPERPRPVAPPPSSGGSGAVAAAESQLGVPYVYAASSPGSGFDCSGLTSWAWAQVGVSIPRVAAAQYAAFPKVPDDQLQPGDLVFFGSPIHHVGMYVGDGQMIHAPHTGDVVRYASIWRSNYVGAARPG